MLVFLALSIFAHAQTPNTWVSGSDREFFFSGNELVYNYNGITNKVGLSDDGFFISTNGFITDQYKPNTNKLVFLQYGKNALLEFRDDTESFSEVFADVAYDPTQGPFTAAIEYDRKFRVYNRLGKISWEWPLAENQKKVELMIMENGGVKSYQNFLRAGEYLQSVDGDWFIFLTNKGALIDNDGNILNEKDISGVESSTILEMDKYGKVSILDNTGTVLSTIMEGEVPDRPPVTFKTTLTINKNGLLLLSNGNVIKDLNDNARRISDNYFPISSVNLKTCVTRIGSKLMMKACTANNYNQRFSYHQNYFRILSDPSKCVVRQGIKLIVDDCTINSKGIIFSNVEKDGTIRTSDNMCFDSSELEVKLSSCNLWETNKNVFTFTQNFVNSKDLVFKHIYNNDKSLKISTYANGWLNANISQTLPLTLMNKNDNVRWAFDSNNALRFSPNLAYCMDIINEDTVIPRLCNTAAKWNYIDNKIYDENNFNCLIQNKQDILFKRCGSVTSEFSTWYMIKGDPVNPGNETSTGDYELIDTFSMYDGKNFGKFGIDSLNHLHKEDFCYSSDLKEISCKNPKLGKFKYENNQIKLMNTNLVINNKFKLEENIFKHTQYMIMGKYEVVTGTLFNKIYNLNKPGECLGLNDGIISIKKCTDSDDFFVKDNKIVLSSNIDFCLNGDKTSICSLAKPFKLIGPTIISNDDKCLTGTGLQVCNGNQYFSLNEQDILSVDLKYDPIYDLNAKTCVNYDANNRAVSSTCENAEQWSFDKGKLRNKKNPFFCLELDSKNQVMYSECKTTVWSDNSATDNSFKVGNLCLENVANQYFARNCGQKFSFNPAMVGLDYVQMVSFGNNKCVEANNGIQNCLDIDAQKWAYTSSGNIQHITGKCLSNLLNLETCGVSTWIYESNQLTHKQSNLCLSNNMQMVTCIANSIDQKWNFGKIKVPDNVKFQKFYQIYSDKYLLNNDIAINNGMMFDAFRCYDDNLQAILCEKNLSKWEYKDGFIINHEKCLTKDLTYKECNVNDGTQMWSNSLFNVPTEWVDITPSLKLSSNSPKLEYGTSDVKFFLSKDGLLRNSKNPYYCLDRTASFSLCTNAAVWNNKLISGTLCIEYSDNLIKPAVCNNANNQKWIVGKDITPPPITDYKIFVNKKYNTCLDYPNNPGWTLLIHTCHSGDNQQWSISSGELKVKSHPSLCFDNTLKPGQCTGKWTYINNAIRYDNKYTLDSGGNMILYLYDGLVNNDYQTFTHTIAETPIDWKNLYHYDYSAAGLGVRDGKISLTPYNVRWGLDKDSKLRWYNDQTKCLHVNRIASDELVHLVDCSSTNIVWTRTNDQYGVDGHFIDLNGNNVQKNRIIIYKGSTHKWLDIVPNYKNINKLNSNIKLTFNELGKQPLGTINSWSKFWYINGIFYIWDAEIMFCLHAYNLGNGGWIGLAPYCDNRTSWNIGYNRIKPVSKNNMCMDLDRNLTNGVVHLWECSSRDAPEQLWSH